MIDFAEIRNHADSLSVTDPANGNNDLTPALVHVKSQLVLAAKQTLAQIDKQGWQSTFGPVDVEDKRAAAIRVVAAVPAATQYRPHAG